MKVMQQLERMSRSSSRNIHKNFEMWGSPKGKECKDGLGELKGRMMGECNKCDVLRGEWRSGDVPSITYDMDVIAWNKRLASRAEEKR